MSKFKVDNEQIDATVETLKTLLKECEEIYDKEIPVSDVDKGQTHNELVTVCDDIRTTCYYFGQLIHNTIAFLGESSEMFVASERQSSDAITVQSLAVTTPLASTAVSAAQAKTHTGNNANMTASLGNILKETISNIPEDARSAGEALGWIEKKYGELPNWLTLGVDVVVPSSLQDAYTLTSGLLQGDLTLKEGWDAAKHILSENTKLAVICETLDYTFETGIARSDEMNRQLEEQIAEGDILGAVFDGAEGFIDTIIGGSVDVIGDVAGGAVDSVIDNVPVVKGINMLTEYGTGLLGWNDGEGYSIGGLIGGATEKISEGIDVVTNVITDTTDVVTDAVTDGVKTGINWVKSWFD